MSGTEGYAEQAGALIIQYESIAFADAHGWIRPWFPPPPARVLDIGAGTGRDAAGFAALGHQVLAVEPTAPLRAHAMTSHPSERIEWLDDRLPDLARVLARGETFDLVTMIAVWMHLDAGQRAQGMPNVAALVKPGGVLAMSLRRGPVPAGRRMFHVSADETIELAARAGLALLARHDGEDSMLKRPGVTWTRLAFTRPAA